MLLNVPHGLLCVAIQEVGLYANLLFYFEGASIVASLWSLWAPAELAQCTCDNNIDA